MTASPDPDGDQMRKSSSAGKIPACGHQQWRLCSFAIRVLRDIAIYSLPTSAFTIKESINICLSI